MTLFILCGTGSSSTTRINILALIIIVLVSSFSYCSSSLLSSVGSSSVDIANNIDKFDIDKNINGENNDYHRLPFRSSSSAIHHLNAAEHPIISKNYLLHLLLKSALNKEEDRPHRRYEVPIQNRRYAPQSFHAMRG
jgi:hypothetical protein